MVTLRIDEDDLLNMLMERVGFWTDDEDTCELFAQYYERMIDDGCFSGAELNIKSIVDNDYVNWFDVVADEDLDDYFDDGIDVEERVEAKYNGYNLVYMG